MNKVLVVLVCVVPALRAGPIYVSGSGTFAYDGMDGEYSISFSGTDGVNSVSVGANVYSSSINPAAGLSAQFPGWMSGAASVDGFSVFPGNPDKTFTFSLGGGSGWVAIKWYGQQVAYEEIRGYIQVTSFNDPGCCGFYERSGTFTILPALERTLGDSSAPEPAPAELIAMGLGLLGFGRWAHRRRRVSGAVGGLRYTRHRGP